MAIDAKIHGILKEKLGDEKVKIGDKEKSLLEVITGKDGWYELATEAFPNVKGVNDDLKSQREEWKTKESEYKKNIDDITKERDSLKNSQLSDADREKLKNVGDTGMTPEAQEKYNSLEKSVTELNSTVKTLSDSIAQERENAKSAKLSSEKNSLRAAIITELNKNKIEGSKADTALAEIEAKGYVKVEAVEDGSIARSFRVFDGDKPLGVDTLPEMVQRYSDGRDYLKSGSRNGGSGDSHNNNNSRDSVMTPTQMLARDDGYDN